MCDPSPSSADRTSEATPRPSQLAPLENWFTDEARRRTFGPLKNIVAEVYGVPGLVGLHGGLPPPNCFPLAGLTMATSQGQVVAVDAAQLSAVQMQYNQSPTGYPPLREWAERYVRRVHAPPAPCHVMVTDGNSHALEIVTSMFMRPGDPILVEEYTYPHMLECVILPKGGVPLAVPMDAQGIVPAQLQQVLERLRSSGEPVPRLLYTVPVGQNPTGAVTPAERKGEIYGICREYDIVIVEDDPYFFLQYPGGEGDVPGVQGLEGSGSYLSLDTDGRVIRCDSFSKFFSPGLRLGWAAAQPAVIERMSAMLQGHSLGASGVTQLMTSALLAAWDDEGLEAHVCGMQREYARRAGLAHEAALRELGGLAEWERPTAGMFMWIKLLGLEDASDIQQQLKEARVVVVPGRIAHPRVYDPHFKCPWVRLAFSYVPDEELREGIARLGGVLRQLRASSA